MIYLKKTNFIFIKLKNLIIPASFVLFTILLVVFSKSNLYAAKAGLSLFANSVLPSLLPFFIATELLTYTGIVPLLGKALNRFMRPIFNVPGVGAFAFIMGIISGYPVGAKIVTNFRQNEICTKEEGERLIAFTNNSGPLFIIASVGISLFFDTRTGILLFITHLLACISVGFIFRFWKRNSKNSSEHSKNKINLNQNNLPCNISSLGEILSKSISSAISNIVMIGGFVVLFSVIVSILEKTHFFHIISLPFYPICNLLNIDTAFIPAFFSGIVELTNGVKNVSVIATKYISTNVVICSFLLGFGGLSVALQVLGIISKTDISFKPYIIGKFLQGTFSAIYTYLALKYINFFNLNLVTTFNSIKNSHPVTNKFIWIAIGFVVICSFILIKKHKLKYN